MAIWLVSPAAPAGAQGWSSLLTGPREAHRLGSQDVATRLRAAHRLGTHGDAGTAIRALTEALRTERDAGVQRQIVESLTRRGDPSAVPALVAALISGSAVDRAGLTRALASFESDAAIAALVEALARDDVRAAAIEGLVRMGPAAVPHLVRAARHMASPVAALGALGAIGDMRATAVLVAYLGHEREEVRAAAADALGELRDAAAANPLATLLDDPSPAVVRAALVALGYCGQPAHARLLTPFIADGTPVQRRAALRSLAQIDPAAAVPIMEHAVSAGDPVLAHASVEQALVTTHPGVMALLFGLVEEGTRAREAASALAELEGGAGLDVLERVAIAGGPHAADAALALALGVREWGDHVDDARLRRVWRLLTGPAPGGDTHRRLLLRAIARDPWVETWLVRALGSPSPARRAIAAMGIEMLGHLEDSAPLLRTVEGETDPEAFRRAASAARVLRVEVALATLWGRMEDPETAPEAMALAATVSASAPARDRRRLGVLLRRGLRAADPRVRAGSAGALALADDRDAWRALAAAVEDPVPEVRRSAARALSVLGVPAAGPALAARSRMEADPVVTDALRDAIDAPDSRPRDPLAPEGESVLRVRIVAAGEEGQAGVPVDVLLPDGRWERMRTLATGELFVVSLPAGTADVRVRISP